MGRRKRGGLAEADTGGGQNQHGKTAEAKAANTPTSFCVSESAAAGRRARACSGPSACSAAACSSLAPSSFSSGKLPG